MCSYGWWKADSYPPFFWSSGPLTLWPTTPPLVSASVDKNNDLRKNKCQSQFMDDFIKIYYHQHHCSHSMAAAFDFTSFFHPGFLKTTSFLYSLAVFAWIQYFNTLLSSAS